MALELLEAVRQAEGKADQIRRDALDQAREMVKSVEEATLESTRQVAAELRGAYQTRMNEYRGAMEAKIAQSAGEKQADLEKLRKDADVRLPRAATLIVERILDHGDR